MLEMCTVSCYFWHARNRFPDEELTNSRPYCRLILSKSYNNGPVKAALLAAGCYRLDIDICHDGLCNSHSFASFSKLYVCFSTFRDLIRLLLKFEGLKLRSLNYPNIVLNSSQLPQQSACASVRNSSEFRR